MNGIDVSNYQSDLDLDRINYDFVLIKATQGTTYVNPHCDIHVQQANAAGKKFGIYHYADGGDAVAEANWFVDNCAGYIRCAIFVLDWEGDGVEDVGWAKLFLEHVESRIGYKPTIYMSESVENAYDWSSVVAGNFGLWIAKYRDNSIDSNYDMSNAGPAPVTKYWPFYYIWQWTSSGRLDGYVGDLDCNRAYINPEQWDAYAGVPTAAPVPGPVPQPAPDPAPTPAPQPEPAPAPLEPSPPTDSIPVPITVTPVPAGTGLAADAGMYARSGSRVENIIKDVEAYVMKSGYKTTEFWVTAYATVGQLLLNGFGVHVPSLEQIVTLAVGAVYVWGRSYLKSKTASK
jgi:GH25 family lysozyme M1 (1,4-beta-N-acetylmuramidase)